MFQKFNRFVNDHCIVYSRDYIRSFTSSSSSSSYSSSNINWKLISGITIASLGCGSIYFTKTNNLISDNNNNNNKLLKCVTEPGIEPYCSKTNTTKNHATIETISKITDCSKYKSLYPIISLDEVRSHYSRDIGDGHIWVTFKGGVYDVTTFLDHHPGGSSRIEMVGGNDLSGYWKIYTLHFRKHIQKLLQKYRIGNLTLKDQKIIESESLFNNYYKNQDPIRDPNILHADTITNDLIIASLHPYNVEPRSLKILSDNYYTPNKLFWIRNHNAVPIINENEYELEIHGKHINNIKLTLNEIKTKFQKYQIPVTIQCAGNRQEDYNTNENPLYVAPHWHNTAIGNALWGGCKLRDILNYAGLNVNEMSINDISYNDLNWVSFIGYDEDETGIEYGGMIPIEKAIDPLGDCLLVYEMNGKILPRDHGYPIRLIAPGHAGCRQVKWLKTIELLDKPSELDSGSKLDRHFSPNICFDKLRCHNDKCKNNNISDNNDSDNDDNDEINDAPVLQTLPVQSIICDWKNIDNNKLLIRGIAWAGGGNGIARVDVSINSGKTFKAAKIISPIKQKWKRNWAWIHFESYIKLNEKQINELKNGNNIQMEIVSKAIDDNFNAQPETMEPYYNVLGVCINHWKKVNIELKPV